MVFIAERARPEERTRNMRGIDWNTEAVRVANYITRRIVDMHRGALALASRNRGRVRYGFYDYSADEKSREVVQLLTQIVDIPAWKTEKLAFGINDEEDAGRDVGALLDPALSDDVGGLSILSTSRSGPPGISPMVAARKAAAIHSDGLPKRRRSASSSRQAALPRSKRQPAHPLQRFLPRSA